MCHPSRSSKTDELYLSIWFQVFVLSLCPILNYFHKQASNLSTQVKPGHQIQMKDNCPIKDLVHAFAGRDIRSWSTPGSQSVLL